MRVEFTSAIIYAKVAGKGALVLCWWAQKRGWQARDKLMLELSDNEISGAFFLQELNGV